MGEPDRRRTEHEFESLNVILGEDQPVSIFTWADDDALELVVPFDSRDPDSNILQAWRGDERFPWNVVVVFPNAEQVLHFTIESWFCHDASADVDLYGYRFSLLPLSPALAGFSSFLDLHVWPGALGDSHINPRVSF